MAEKTNAKKKVGTATRKFDKILKSVKDRMTQNKEHSTSFLESISCDLSNTHADVEKKLESYRELLDSDDESDKPEVERTDAGLDKLRKDLTEVQILLEDLKVKEANSKKDKLKINAKKKVGTATRKYHKVLKAVKEKMSQNKEHSSGFLVSLSAEISSAYAEAEIKLEEYRELLDSGDEDDDSEVTTTDGELDSIRDSMTDVQIQLDQLKLNEVSTAKSTKKEESASKMKRFDPPKFSGNLRDYPAFITHYETHVEQQHGKDTYALWNCLDDTAKKVVQPVIDDYDEMKERLRKKYGSPEKQVDSILQQIKSLTRVADGDTKGLVHMIETVEMCWLDLKRLKLESEMNTTTMISEIERLLPTLQKREWTLQKPNNAEFIHLKDFLVKEKQAVEYMTEDIRSTNKHTKSRVNFAGITEGEPVESTNVIVNLLEKQLESHNQLMKIMTQTMTKNPTSKQVNTSDRINRSGVNYRCWLHKSNGHDTVECSSFAGLDNQEKVAMSRRNGACFCCLKTGHISRQCQEKIQCGEIDQNNQPCTRYHHKLLHAAHIDGQIFHNAVHVVNADENGRRNQAILMVSSLNVKGHRIGTLWDPGANTTLITHRAARRLNLRGVDVFLTITKVGNECQSGPSKEYVIPVSDLQGKIWEIKAYGIDEITANVSPIELHGIADLFKNITEQDIQRPHGKIDILIASDCCRMLPDKVQEVGDLQLMKNQFGYCLRGSHPMIKLHTQESNHVVVKIHHLDADVKNANINISMNEDTIQKNMEKFFAIEGMGVCCAQKCGSCQCGKWSNDLKNITIREEKEMKLIQNGLSYSETEKCWTVYYPWIRDPHELPNNINAVIGRMKALERRLKRVGNDYLTLYNDQILDMLRRNVARKLSQEEVNAYDGPVHYIAHHEVLKPDSISTPVRQVFDSSSSFMGHRLNDYWAKGPDVINSLIGVLMRFRQGTFAIAGDISKMYNSVKLSTFDQHTHRFVWRNGDLNKVPDHYALTNVSFGDRPSGAIVIIALRATADMSKDTHPIEAEIIKKDTYVDDLLTSVNNEDQVIPLMSGIESVLAKGGFKIKHWITSSKLSDKHESTQLNILNTDNERVLGLIWNPERDQFGFRVKINFSSKRNKLPTQSDLDRNRINEDFPQVLTKRIVLSQVAKVYDPLGLITPVILRAKLLLRKSCQTDQCHGWDDPLPKTLYEEWKDFFKQLFSVEDISFPRCFQPRMCLGKPILVVYDDGSKEAFGACAYARWEVNPKCFWACLIMAKNRVSPRRTISIPKIELCGAVIGVRLRQTIVEELDLEFSCVMHITDSQIVRCQIQKESHGFKTFTANRIAEVQTKSDPNEWWWVASKDNPADLTTRSTLPEEIGEDSIWQNGPDYLKWDVDQWPISQSCYDDELPDRVGVILATDVQKCWNVDKQGCNLSIIDIERFSSLSKLLKVTAIVLLIINSKSFAKANNDSMVRYLHLAELQWIKFYQDVYRENWQKTLRNLSPSVNKEGIIVVGSRLSNHNIDLPMVLPRKCRYAKLYCKSIHDETHSGVDTTVTKVRSRIWIPGITRLVKEIKKGCVICRFLEKFYLEQRMGLLPVERLRPAPAFFHCAVDIFGPYTIKDAVKRRTKGKAYGIIFNCLYSRAVYLDLAEGYDTRSFILALRRFVSVRGYPSTMRADQGSQLVCASKELQKMISETWNWDSIYAFGEQQNMKWLINKVADAPWENGCSEALIKSTKRCLTQSVGTNILTFSELQTALFDVASLLNERPIGTKTTDPNEGAYLCPNDLLLGRTSRKAPIGHWTASSDSKVNLSAIYEIIESFWKKWIKFYFPTLIVQKKWHTDVRNVCVGDIVLLQQDSNDYKGIWRLAQVSEILDSSDGRVRSVRLRYKRQGPNGTYKGLRDTHVDRSVHRLVMILPVEEQTQ